MSSSRRICAYFYRSKERNRGRHQRQRPLARAQSLKRASGKFAESLRKCTSRTIQRASCAKVKLGTLVGNVPTGQKKNSGNRPPLACARPENVFSAIFRFSPNPEVPPTGPDLATFQGVFFNLRSRSWEPRSLRSALHYLIGHAVPLRRARPPNVTRKRPPSILHFPDFDRVGALLRKPKGSANKSHSNAVVWRKFG